MAGQRRQRRRLLRRGLWLALLLPEPLGVRPVTVHPHAETEHEQQHRKPSRDWLNRWSVEAKRAMAETMMTTSQ